jgi:hypothetical protein
MTDRRLLASVQALEALLLHIVDDVSKKPPVRSAGAANSGENEDRNESHESMVMSGGGLGGGVEGRLQKWHRESLTEGVPPVDDENLQEMCSRFVDDLVNKLNGIAAAASSAAESAGPQRLSSSGTPLPPPTILTIQQLRYIYTAVELVWSWGMKSSVQIVGGVAFKYYSAAPTALLLTETVLKLANDIIKRYENVETQIMNDIVIAQQRLSQLFDRAKCMRTLSLSKVFSSMLIQRNLKRIVITLLLLSEFPTTSLQKQSVSTRVVGHANLLQANIMSLRTNARTELLDIVFDSSSQLKSACVIALRTLATVGNSPNNRWVVQAGGRLLTDIIMSPRGVEATLLAYLQGVTDDPDSVNLQVKVAKLITTVPAQLASSSSGNATAKDQYLRNVSVQIAEIFRFAMKIKDLVLQKVCVMMITRIAAADSLLCSTHIFSVFIRPLIRFKRVVCYSSSIDTDDCFDSLLAEHDDSTVDTIVVCTHDELAQAILAVHSLLTLCPVLPPLSRLLMSECADALLLLCICCFMEQDRQGAAVDYAEEDEDAGHLRTSKKIYVVGSDGKKGLTSSSDARVTLSVGEFLSVLLHTTFLLLQYVDVPVPSNDSDSSNCTSATVHWLLEGCLFRNQLNKLMLIQDGVKVIPGICIGLFADSTQQGVTFLLTRQRIGSSSSSFSALDGFDAGGRAFKGLVSGVANSKTPRTSNSNSAMSLQDTLKALSADGGNTTDSDSNILSDVEEAQPSEDLSAILQEARLLTAAESKNDAVDHNDHGDKNMGEWLLRAESIGKAIARLLLSLEDKIKSIEQQQQQPHQQNEGQLHLKNLGSSLFIHLLSTYLGTADTEAVLPVVSQTTRKSACALLVLLLPSYVSMDILMRRADFILNIISVYVQAIVSRMQANELSTSSLTRQQDNDNTGSGEESGSEDDTEKETLQAVLGLLSAVLLSPNSQQYSTQSVLGRLREPLLYLSIHLSDVALNAQVTECVHMIIRSCCTAALEAPTRSRECSQSLLTKIDEISSPAYIYSSDPSMRAYGLHLLMQHVRSCDVSIAGVLNKYRDKSSYFDHGQALSQEEINSALGVLTASLDDPESFVYLCALKSISQVADKKQCRQAVLAKLLEQFIDRGNHVLHCLATLRNR